MIIVKNFAMFHSSGCQISFVFDTIYAFAFGHTKCYVTDKLAVGCYICVFQIPCVSIYKYQCNLNVGSTSVNHNDPCLPLISLGFVSLKMTFRDVFTYLMIIMDKLEGKQRLFQGWDRVGMARYWAYTDIGSEFFSVSARFGILIFDIRDRAVPTPFSSVPISTIRLQLAQMEMSETSSRRSNKFPAKTEQIPRGFMKLSNSHKFPAKN